LSFEYRHIIFNAIINALIEKEDKNDRGLGFNELYEKCKDLLKISGLDYTPSKTDFSNHIKKMIEDNELHKTQDESSKLKIKPQYYSLTDDAKKRRHINLLGAGNEHERFRKIYEKLFFWEFFHTRPIPIPLEQKVHETISKLKQQLPAGRVSDLGWGKATDVSNDFLRYRAGSRRYLEYWNNEEKPEMIIQHIDNIYHITPTPEIFFTKREYWQATKHSKKMLFVKYILSLPGVSKEEFLTYNNNSSEVKFTDQEIEKALQLLKESGLIKPYFVYENEIRYVTTNDDLSELIREISQIFEQELRLLMFRWRYFEKPTEEEKKRLRWMLGEKYAKSIIQSAEIAMYENKKALRKSKDINEYCEFLRRDLSGLPTWAADGEIFLDTHGFVHKNKDKNIKDVVKEVHGFYEFRRERQRWLESDLIDGIKDIKKIYERTVQEYAYLFHHVLTMVCPLLLKLPAESYYSDEEIEAKQIAAYKIEKELNPPGFHDSMRRHTDEYGIVNMDEVGKDMEKARKKLKRRKKSGRRI
jgi:hypothetical protein